VIARGQTLQVGGTNVLPLPNARVFTGSQRRVPDQARARRLLAAARLPGRGRVRAAVEHHRRFPARLADRAAGQRVPRRLATRRRLDPGTRLPARGRARLPRRPGLYEGRTEAFWLDDPATTSARSAPGATATPIDEGNRTLLRTQNRVRFGPTTNLDLVAFHGSRPGGLVGVLPRPLPAGRDPETSTYLHHGDGNRLLTVGSRFNLDDFSYRDDRAIADRFVEELPVVTYQWLAQPIGTTPWDTPIVVDLATEIGQRRSDYDDWLGCRRATARCALDQLSRCRRRSALGDLNLRPYRQRPRHLLRRGRRRRERRSRRHRDRHPARHAAVAHLVVARRRRGQGRAPRDVAEAHLLEPLPRRRRRHRVLHVRRPRPAGRATARAPRTAQPAAAHGDAGRPAASSRATSCSSTSRRTCSPTRPATTTAKGSGCSTTTCCCGRRMHWNAVRDLQPRALRRPRLAGRPAHVRHRAAVRPAARPQLDARVPHRRARRRRRRLSANTQPARTLGPVRPAASATSTATSGWPTQFGLRRNDHDWAIELSATYNPFADETTFRIEFQPRLGSFSPARGSRFQGFVSPDQFATSY
jgi:hypothetical protein